MKLNEAHNYSCSAIFSEMESWLQANCTGYWTMMVVDRPNGAGHGPVPTVGASTTPRQNGARFIPIEEDGLLVSLQSDEDAILFELRWKGSIEMKSVDGAEIAEPAFTWDELNPQK
jgi:hypothetical protein